MLFWVDPSVRLLAHWHNGLRLCAVGLGLSYCSAYLLASLCLATSLFHLPSDPEPRSHHHAGAHQHDHDQAPSSEGAWADICDVALHVLLSDACQQAPKTVVVQLIGEALRGLHDAAISLHIPTYISIRAPPFATVI